MGFHKTCKILIDTETAYKSGTPHLLATSIGSYILGLDKLVEFNYKDVYDREDNYADVVGFYHTHSPELNQMSSIDIQTMTQWVSCLGKSLICLIETNEQISGWILIKGEHEITYREVSVQIKSDVNYDIWLDKQKKFWNSADFLMEDNFEDEEANERELLIEPLEDINDALEGLKNGFGILISMMEQITATMAKDDDD